MAKGHHTNLVNIIEAPAFKKRRKKLHKNQKTYLDKAVKEISINPKIGTKKVGDLTEIRVHKFKMVKQEQLIAYIFVELNNTVNLLYFNDHENFYAKLKKQIK